MNTRDIIRRLEDSLPGWKPPTEIWTSRTHDATSVAMLVPHAAAIILASVKEDAEQRFAHVESGLACVAEAVANDRWYAVVGAYAGYGPTEIEAFLAACEAAKGNQTCSN